MWKVAKLQRDRGLAYQIAPSVWKAGHHWRLMALGCIVQNALDQVEAILVGVNQSIDQDNQGPASDTCIL